ncbi:MAG: esterase-like activity of phytase family protein [Enhydrobacter sp.]|nr:MAG: esterase-like activity of phytase family protein [Enhydrobacter sp.]
MRAAFRSFTTFCLLIAAACAGAPPPAPVGAQDLSVQIRSSVLTLKLDDPQARQVGRLKWRGGVAMTASSPNFGGWSDLHVAPDGRSLTAISDEGSWLTAIVAYDSDGNLAGLSGARIGSLRGLDGLPIRDKALADAEGLARLPDGGWLVSFERQHRIWRYAELDAPPKPVEGAPEFAQQPNNGGIEALAALPDGRVVAISEDLATRSGATAGWIGTPAGNGRYNWQGFAYAARPDFRPTALTRLPDGSFAALERAFDMVRGVRCRVVRFPASQLQPGGTVQPEELAFLASPYAVDNLEGIAATVGRRGETLLWLMSDDNFNPLQRNILLLFELEN